MSLIKNTTCDNCHNILDKNPELWISLQGANDTFFVALFKGGKHLLTSNQIDFCCVGCLNHYLTKRQYELDSTKKEP